MNTTDLFNFEFVDRDTERKIFDSFFEHEEENVLWVRGGRGLGKTYFTRYVYSRQMKYDICYMDVKINGSSVDILSDFLLKLEEHCEIEFMTNVKKFYKGFYNQVYKKTEAITSTVFPKISSYAEVITSLAYYAVTRSDEKKNPVDLIKEYIELILAKKKLFICIDNFSRCNLETARIFFDVIKNFLRNKNFRACIITTSEDLCEDLNYEISRFLPYKDIEIRKLEKYDYFFQILDPIFDLAIFTDTDLKYIWYKCEGNPKKLSTIISKLLEKHGIFLHNTLKAQIDKKMLFSILQENHIKFKAEDFSSTQKWVIFSYLCFNSKVNVKLLSGLAAYITEKNFLFHSFNKDMFSVELLGLIENKVLCCEPDGMVGSCHDADYIELRDIFNESNLKGIFSQCAYEFILQQPSLSDQEELLCRHSRVANITGWEKRNFRYGKKLFRSGQFYEAQQIFNCLSNFLHNFHPMQILQIALSSYEAGNYKLAIEQLLYIQCEQLHFHKAKYYYYFYLGKSYNNTGKVIEASEILQNALREVPVDSALYVQTLNLLQMYYYEIPDKGEEAERIFQEVREKYKTKYPDIWANTMRGCQNFVDNHTARTLLLEAYDILSDELEKAYIKNTLGFVFIKDDNFEDAEECFREAYDKIKKLKIHECSYAASNLSVCYMMRRDFHAAKEILLQALLWNRTNYGDIVLQTHLLICCVYLNCKKEAERYYNFLKQYMESNSPVDDILKRKVFMNLAIAGKKLDYLLESSRFYKAKPYVKNSSSEWRYSYLTNESYQAARGKELSKYYKVTDFDPWFLIYAHD